MLLAARDEDGEPMSDRLVRDEVMTLLLAGHETTANALTWTWLLLDQHPAAAARLHAEVDALPGPPTADDLAALPCTNAVLAESMRIWPPAWASGRRILQDVTLGDWPVPAGSLVSAVQWLTHRDPRWWPDPLEFRPERWLTPEGAYDESAPGQPRGAYFPFGMGTRVCIGGSFARTEATMCWPRWPATGRRRWWPGTWSSRCRRPSCAPAAGCRWCCTGVRACPANLRRRRPTPRRRPAALSSSPIQQRYRTPPPPCRIDAWTPSASTKIRGTRPNPGRTVGS